jgi:hypothetical protein
MVSLRYKEEIMKIKGEYRDRLTTGRDLIKDTGWQSNTITGDYGKFLAALMKKEFNKQVGVEYIAVGSGSDNFLAFRQKTAAYFNMLKEDKPGPYPPYLDEEKNYWIWVKKITPGDMTYLYPKGSEETGATNRLSIEVTFTGSEPAKDTFDFKEFGLLGIDRDANEKFDTQKMFFINYVDHGQITKDEKMELTRTVKLSFPINNE